MSNHETDRGIRDRVCVIGVGETEYTKHGRIGRPEFRLALEAILAACADAGLDPRQIDGFSSYSADRNDPNRLSTALDLPHYGFASMVYGGGGGGVCAAIGNAAAGIHAGYARFVVVYRALAQGEFGRFGLSRRSGRLRGAYAFNVPQGLMSPAQFLAMRFRRHMHEYGTTSEQLGQIAVAANKHAQRNPRAVMNGRPITLEDHQNSRMIADPYRLYDCCLETDGAAAMIVAPAEVARDFPHRPVYLAGSVQGSGHRQGNVVDGFWHDDFLGSNYGTMVDRLYAAAGMGPEEIDCAQLYENFTGQVLTTIEDHKFCARGEGGPFVEGGRLEHADVAEAGAPHAGAFPINTSGGNLAEAYTHGFNLAVEAVRQLRGDSPNPIEGARTCLVAAGPASAPISSAIFRN